MAQVMLQTNESFLQAIEYLVENELLVIDVTQCPQGMVELGLYEASAPLLDRGVISGLDMTPEAVLCKLMWLFGMGWDVEQVKKQVQLDQRGEQSLNIFLILITARALPPRSLMANSSFPEKLNLINWRARYFRYVECD